MSEWTVAIGVDTHKRTHTAVALDRFGNQLDLLEIEVGVDGYERLRQWAIALGECVFAIEGASSYGAGLASFLVAEGLCVFECERPRRRERQRGKSDPRDALLAARRVLAPEEGLSQLRGGGIRELLRVLLLERRSADQARTATLNQLHALAVTAPEALRAQLGQLKGEPLARAAARLQPLAEGEDVLGDVLRRLGERALTLSDELDQTEGELQRLLERHAQTLLSECGVGSICAAQLLVSSGDPTRMRSEASFAALAGTSPVEASSGAVKRHRLNRGGDRALNRALHMIALNRCRFHPETAAYYTRLLERGKSKREARRCVKRMLARYFFRRLHELPALAG